MSRAVADHCYFLAPFAKVAMEAHRDISGQAALLHASHTGWPFTGVRAWERRLVPLCWEGHILLPPAPSLSWVSCLWTITACSFQHGSDHTVLEESASLSFSTVNCRTRDLCFDSKHLYARTVFGT